MERNPDEYLPLEALEHGRLYRFRARNFSLGIYNENAKGFIGIRTKFGDRFLFTEYHWDADPRYGTVQPIEALDARLPDDIPVVESLGTRCGTCGNHLEYVRVLDEADGSTDIKRSHWKHIEGVDCGAPRAYRDSNKALFAWLEEHGAK